MSSLVRIRRQPAQNWHWKNSKKRPSQKILARSGHAAPGIRIVQERHLTTNHARQNRVARRKKISFLETEGVPPHGLTANTGRIRFSRRTSRLARHERS